MKNNLILQKVNFLHGTLYPDWVDGGTGQPGGPLFSVEGVSLSGAMVRQGGSLHYGQRPAYPLRYRGA